MRWLLLSRLFLQYKLQLVHQGWQSPALLMPLCKWPLKTSRSHVYVPRAGQRVGRDVGSGMGRDVVTGWEGTLEATAG